jgi:ABC-type multidrug transport system ATPase subunit
MCLRFVGDVSLTGTKFHTKQVNLYETRKRKSKALSGGMRRRLSVAMACIGSPDILILDEPTTGLDPASRRQVWEVIENVKEGRSVVSNAQW